MRHQDLALNHRLESYVYANNAARTGAGGFVPGDIGRIAYQQDTGQYWRLISTAPGWQIIASAGYASLQTGIIANPTSTSSTTAVMMGLGTSIKLTPTATGKVQAIITGRMNNATASIPTTAQMYYGTGTAPVNGVATTGSATGFQAISYNSIANGTEPFALTSILTGLAVGTQYWFDIALLTGATGTAAIGGPVGTLIELP